MALVVAPQRAAHAQLAEFHDTDYLEVLAAADEGDGGGISADVLDEHCLVDDCAPFPGVAAHAAWIAGASVEAAAVLVRGQADVAIHWAGGRHHARHAAAGGFCYVNDVVLAVQQLQLRFERVLYVDVDLHHGDGVEEAFAFATSVATVSLHKHAPGFFPGTGSVDDVGRGAGRYCAINVPLLDGLRDAAMQRVIDTVLPAVHARFVPDVVVVQCGCDGLNGDPWQTFNLTPAAYVACLRLILSWDLPVLLLGGGGYHAANVARCWAALTAVCVDVDLPDDIPPHDHLDAYAPDFQRTVEAGGQPDRNTDARLAALCATVLANVARMPQQQQ